MSAHKPTSFDIAELAGVSQPTVSRALRGDRTVSEATRKRIEAIAAQLNYKVDKNASSLRRGATHTLALLFFEDAPEQDSPINPFFLSMLGSITRTCARRGYDLLVSTQQLSGDWHVDYEDSRKADGIILLGYGDFETYRTRITQLERQGTHYIRWGAVRPDAPDQPRATIGCDNVQGGRLAADHLIARGRRSIAYLGDASEHSPEYADRYRGLCAGMRAAGLRPDLGLQVDVAAFEHEGYLAAQRLIARGIAFDAIFAASDLIAVGAMRALADAGRRVPEDVAIVGFDDVPAAGLTSPALTTVAQDYGGAGVELVDRLVAQIAGAPPTPAVLPVRLVVRASS